MQPPQVFYISRRSILEEVSAHTGLAIHRYGSTTNKAGLVKGCVVVDVPKIEGRPLETRRAFYGEHKGDLDGALESAAEVALRHLSDDYGVVIKDWNYEAFAACRQSLLAAVESRRKMEAETEAALKEAIRYKRAIDMLVQDIKDLCLRFAGLLPVRAGGASGIEYVGPPSPPTGGFDKLALDLVQVVQSAYDELPVWASSPLS
jgi:hypothetical protein